MKVVDASIVVLGLLNDGASRNLLSEGFVAAPHLIDIEVTSALLGQVRGRVVAQTDAERALSRWSALGVERYPHFGLVSRIWELRDNVSAYDAAYVALAEALDCELITADVRISGAPGLRCPVTILSS